LPIILALALTLVATQTTLAADVTDERLRKAGTDAEAANWLTVHRSYDSHRFSPLNEINRSTVKNLKLAYAVPLGGWEPSELGNSVPMFDPEYRPGDNLYSNTALALDIETGKLVWYFQYTPGDYFDFDETGSHLLIDREINGEKRKVVAHFGRNGFFYRLDRTNGSFIGAKEYVEKLSWTKGIDQNTGKPLGYDPSADVQEYVKGIVPRRDGPDRVTSCPHVQGGVNYWPTAYNPDLKLAYGASIEACQDIILRGQGQGELLDSFREFRGAGEPFLAGGVAVRGRQKGALLALDVATGTAATKVSLEYPNYSGILATRGNLIFTGHMDGDFSAYDAATLSELWKINLGVEFQAPPMTFAVNGKQYVAIMGGGGGLAPGVNNFGLA
jgi:alcohol dehydrogenase (cytochrome c)